MASKKNHVVLDQDQHVYRKMITVCEETHACPDTAEFVWPRLYKQIQEAVE